VTPFVVSPGPSTNFIADATAKSLLIPSASYGETGIQLEYNSGTPRFFAGNQYGGFLKFDGTSTQISSSNFNIASNGDVSMTGTVTATAGQIGGFAITPTAISSSNNNLILKSSGQITGSNVKFDGGKIGGFSIGTNSLTTTGVEINDSSQTLFISSSNFKVNHSGDLEAGSATFTGNAIADIIRDRTVVITSANSGSYFAEVAGSVSGLGAQTPGYYILRLNGSLGGDEIRRVRIDCSFPTRTIAGSGIGFPFTYQLAIGSVVMPSISNTANLGIVIEVGDGANVFVRDDVGGFASGKVI
jgi:hypothetical protein